MKKRLLHLGAFLLALLWFIPAAWAEDCFTLDVDTLDLERLSSQEYISAHLTSSAQGIRVRMQVTQSSESAAYVRLTVKQMNTHSLVFDKEYGYVSGMFDSGVIYLPYGGDGATPYLITLYAGDLGYGLPFMHTQRRVSSSPACTIGVRMRDLNAPMGGDWMMGTVLDLNALRRTGRTSVDVCASNSYLIGTAWMTLSGNSLCVDVSFNPTADVELTDHSLYVITDPSDLHSAPAYRIGEWVDVGDASAALLYLPMQLSFDPAGLPAFYYDRGSAQNQADRWNEAAPVQEVPSYDGGWDSWEDSGWSNDGWADPNYGWDDGWESDAPGWVG